MSEIRFVTCGEITLYAPSGGSKPASLYQLQYYGAKGAVLTTPSHSEPVMIQPDNAALTKAVSAIEALPDCPCESRPKFNEIYLLDGTYRYAAFEDLRQIMQDLEYSIISETLAQNPLPNPAGITASESAPTHSNQIEKVRVETDGCKYRLTAGAEQCTLFVHAGSSIEQYQFAPAHPAYQKALQKLQEINPMRMTDHDPSEGIHEIQYQGCTTAFRTHAEKLLDILNDLQYGLDTDTENVEIRHISDMVTLQGAVAYHPQNNQQMMGMMGMVPPAETPAQQPQTKSSAVLHEDGSWDCACGIKGLTSKFCYNCGAAKPAEWKCTACGAENTGKFCRDCGSPKPWKCGCGEENTGKFCCNCGAPRP